MRTFRFAMLSLIATASLPLKGAETNTVSPGELRPDSITAAVRTNYYSFSALSNQVIYLAVVRTNGPGNFPKFNLYDPASAVKEADSHANFAEVTNYFLPRSGNYTVEVYSSNDAFDYLVSLTVIGATNRRELGDGEEALEPGRMAGGQISVADFDTFTFSGSSNQVIYLTVVRTNSPGTTPAFYLYDPDGVATVSSISEEFAELANHRLSKQGLYTVAIFEGGLTRSFNYVINVTVIGANNFREPGDGAQGLVPGRVTPAHMSMADMDTFTFTGSSNQTIYLAVVITNEVATEPAFYLYDPAGNSVLSSYSERFAELANHRLSMDGFYTAAVYDGGLNETFDYTVCLITAPGTNDVELEDGDPMLAPNTSRLGRISPGDLDAFAFEAIAGDTVSLRLDINPGDSEHMFIQLYGPDGRLFGPSTGATSAVVQVSCLAQTGTYTVFIADSGLVDSFGYTLSMFQSPVVPPSSGNTQYLVAYLCSNHVIVRWETNAANFILESASALPTVSWTPVTVPIINIGRHKYLDQGEVTDAAQFFRLRCTNCTANVP